MATHFAWWLFCAGATPGTMDTPDDSLSSAPEGGYLGDGDMTDRANELERRYEILRQAASIKDIRAAVKVRFLAGCRRRLV